MLDEIVEKITNLFEKYGDPSLNADIYNVSESELSLLKTYYIAYSSGILRQIVAIGGKIPRIKERYNGNIDDLISNINKDENLDSKEVIYINNEINNLEHLNKLKETYPDKYIIIKWNNEFAFIDDVISAVYMIDYFKSVIDNNLSSLEKIAMAYDIVKSHQYKEYNKKHTMKSRNITEMVNNDYIVCRGYVAIFNRILSELGINAAFLNLSIKSLDKTEKHSRSLVSVYDEKYNIDGCFVFDPTWDSADKEYYYQFNEFDAIKSKEKKPNYKKADSLAAYNYFLIPLVAYENIFSNSYDEEITFSDTTKFDNESTHEILHTVQDKNKKYALNVFSFVKLIYTVRLSEGYDYNDLPALIQESLFISGYGYYKIEEINNVISSIMQENNNVKSRGFIDFKLFYIIGFIISILTIVYCIFRFSIA